MGMLGMSGGIKSFVQEGGRGMEIRDQHGELLCIGEFGLK